MKYVIWLNIILQILIFTIFADNILSKFHQNGFKIKDFRAELHSYNKKFLNFGEVKTYKYNRTTPAVNASFNCKIFLDDKIEVTVQAYKFMSNEYRSFPMRFQVNLQKSLDANIIGSNKLRSCGNFTNVFFEKNVTYVLCNFILDETRFPPLVPNGKFRFNTILQYLNEEIAIVFAFLEIYTPIPYPKN